MSKSRDSVNSDDGTEGIKDEECLIIILENGAISQLLLSAHLMRDLMSGKSDERTDRLFKVIRKRKRKVGKLMNSVDRALYMGVSLAFAAVLAFIFDMNLRKLFDAGGDLTGAMDGMFALLIPLVFAIIGVYLIILVLHPHFKKRAIPDSIKRIGQDIDAGNMTREKLEEYVSGLRADDEEVREYINTFGVKADIAMTLAISLVAFFLGAYGYIRSFTIGYESDPNILPVSLCFMFIIFAIVYTILKTMKVIWDV
ncbi:MAG: hypothetical protein FWG96_01365 [Methanomassiliicoccaceae archaeon]|nr:hypothetical protein [Methanomassiliicoccaceae archaeon]